MSWRRIGRRVISRRLPPFTGRCPPEWPSHIPGRIFVCFPKWGDRSDFTVAEVKDGRPVAYPDEAINLAKGGPAADRLISRRLS